MLLGKTGYSHSASLHPGKLNVRGDFAMDLHPIWLLGVVASCYIKQRHIEVPAWWATWLVGRPFTFVFVHVET